MNRRHLKGAETLRKVLDTRDWTGHKLQQHTRIAEETIGKWLAGTVRPGRSGLLALGSVSNEGDWGELRDAYGARNSPVTSGRSTHPTGSSGIMIGVDATTNAREAAI